MKPQRNLYFKVATVNVGGWTDDKALRLRQIFERHNPDILIATETRSNLDCALPGKGRTLLVRGVSTKKTGVAVVLPDKQRIIIKQMSERTIHIVHPAGIEIIGAYGPTEQASSAEKQSFWKRMNDHVAAVNSECTIVIGDLNAGHEVCKNPSVMGRGDSNFKRMNDFATLNRLEIQEHGATWISKVSTACNINIPARTLDRCLIRYDDVLSTELTTDFSLRPSDHAILIAKTQFFNISRDKGRPYNTKLDRIDTLWQESKSKLLGKVDQTSVLRTVDEFWKAKRLLEMEEREKLKVINQQGEPLTTEEGLLALRDYFKPLWTDESQVFPKPPIIAEFNAPTCDEITTAIKSLKVNTALGIDRICPDALKRNPQAVGVYKVLLEEIWKTELIPTTWKSMRVKPIPKQNPTAQPQETRPITCLSTSMKIVNKIIMERHRYEYEAALHDSQHAYRMNRSTETAVQQLLTAIKRKGKGIVALLDMTKAYDSIPRATILKALDLWKLPEKERNIIIEQYRDANVLIELEGCVAEAFTLTRGIRQGCGLSCLIFNLAMTIIHRRMSTYLAKHDVSLISYSDDIVLQAENQMAVEVATKLLKEELKEIGLRLNEAKTVIFEFDTGSGDTAAATWLGFELSKNLSWDREIVARVKKMQDADKAIHRVMQSKRIDLSKRDALQIVQSMAGTYTRLPQFITTTKRQHEQLQNELGRIIARYTKSESLKALSDAAVMMKAGFKAKETQILQCQYCQQPFKNPAGLASHLPFCKEHPSPPEAPRVRCPQCKDLIYSRGFARHIKTCRVNVTLTNE